MSSPQRDNFFILLDLDPSVTYSDADIGNRLNEKKAEWTKGTINPKYAKKYSAYLDMIPQITEVMLKNPEARKIEAVAALQVIAERSDEAIGALRRDLNILKSRGYITPEEIAKLVKEYGSQLGEVRIREEVASIPQVVPTSACADKGERLDPVKMRSIRGGLEIVQKRTLYAFLELADSSSLTALQGKANAILIENRDNGLRNAQIDAANELAGESLKIFSSEDEKAKYDRALADWGTDALRDRVQQVCNLAADKRITAEMHQHLIREARQDFKLTVECADEVIRKRVRELNASIEVAPLKQLAEEIRCSNCGYLNDAGNEYCTQCQSPLYIVCPDCGTRGMTSERFCPKCAFPIGNAAFVSDAIQQVERFLSLHEIDPAYQLLQMTLLEWRSKSSTSLLTDPLTQKLNILQVQLGSSFEVIKEIETQMNTAINEQNFYQARQLLWKLEQTTPSSRLDSPRTLIESTIARVEKDLQHAAAMVVAGDDAVDFYNAILEVCRDCKSAHDALGKILPLPPRSLTVENSERFVRLTWIASKSKYVRYQIVRKAQSRPNALTDGVLIATVDNTTFDDTSPEIGVPLFYAVYTVRNGAASSIGALHQEPVQITCDVENLTANVSKDQVELRWTLPHNALGVRIYRTPRAPILGRYNGTVLPTIGKEQAVDLAVVEGDTYYYAVYVVFRTDNGSDILSKGVTIEVTPEAPPTPIDNLSATIVNDYGERSVLLRWDEPQKGMVVIVISSKPPIPQVNDTIPATHLTRLGEIRTTTGTELTISFGRIGTTYFTPIVLFQNMAFVGKTVAVANVDDVTNLNAIRHRDGFQLQWDFPPECYRVVVAYRHDQFPNGIDDPEAVRQTVMKANYDQNGAFVLRSTAKMDHYVTVYAEFTQDGQTSSAAGVTPSARVKIAVASIITITYRIETPQPSLKNPSEFFKKAPPVLHLEITGDGRLPSLLLFSQKGSVPTKKHQGKLVLPPISGIHVSGEFVKDFPIEREAGAYGRLFLEDDTCYIAMGGNIKIIHPSLERSKLG